MTAIVFDTETVGIKTQTLLNVGYKIVDINPSTAEVTKTYVNRDYIVRDLINNEILMLNDAFVGAEKWEQYKQNIASGGAILRTIEQILTTMQNDINRHKVKFGYAYNASFDIDKITKTANQYGIPNPLDSITVFDIWAYAFNHICLTDEYVAYMKANELFTESKRFIRTSVEGVIAFLEKNPSFVEDHTALSDVEWELRILQEVIRRGCDITQRETRGKNIPSGKLFRKTFNIQGVDVEVEFTKTIGKFDIDSDYIKFVNEL